MFGMSVIARKVARRSALRVQLQEIIENGTASVASSEIELASLIGLRSKLEKCVEEVRQLDEEIIAGVDLEKVEAEMMENAKVMDPTFELFAKFQLRIDEGQKSEVESVQSQNASVSGRSQKCRLPKLELSVFRGSALEWQGFIDQFLVTVDQNESLNKVDKFVYLKRYLEGEALDVVSGLSLSADNYKEALDLLRERYGDPEVLISAHLESLLKLGKVRNSSDLVALRKLHNDVENCVRNLRSLNVDTLAYGSLLIPILKEKLPDDLLLQISRAHGSSPWSLDSVLKNLKNELSAKEHCSLVLEQSNRKRNDHFTTSTFFGQSSNKRGERDSRVQGTSCFYCGQKGHMSTQCRKVTNVNSRVEILKKAGRCFLCLKTNHRKQDCSSDYTCRICKGKHHISICPGDNKLQITNTSGEESVPSEEGNEVLTSVASMRSASVLLQTAKAEVSDVGDDVKALTRILFDSGSQRSYIAESVRNHLSLRTVRRETLVVKTFGDELQRNPKIFDVVRVRVKHLDKNSFTEIECLVVPKICSPLQNQVTPVVFRNDKLRDLILADDKGRETSLAVGILVGIDFYHTFFSGSVIRDFEDGLVACDTSLGWVLSGCVGNKADVSQQTCLETHCMKCISETTDSNLTDVLERFWSIESFESTKDVVTSFENEICHNGTRYVCKLPFKPDMDLLPDNFSVCERRLPNLMRKLESNGLTNEYGKIFAEYEKEGIVERVSDIDKPGKVGEVHYLPHRPVVREDKSTTKIRAVFDASCSDGGPSLNDCLYSGPNLLTRIFNMLIGFRLEKIGILADIQQAFLNIEVAKEHRDFLRFLWLEGSRLVVYRFCRVVFGVTSSPFLLNGTIKHHLEKYQATDHDLMTKLLEQFYVDDLISGCNSVAEGSDLYTRLKHIMQQAGFNLRKWVTNDANLQTIFDKKEGKNVTETDSTEVQVLGVTWDVKEDELVCRFDTLIDRARCDVLTKREILSVASSLFDPLGLVGPVSARLKAIFQLLCRNKLSWDEKIYGELRDVWLEFVDGLEQWKEVRVPRVVLGSEGDEVEVHGFCDSSTEVYCAVIYLRVVGESGVGVSFLCGKTKVVPMKCLTIPRLELLSCLLLSELLESVLRTLGDRVGDLFCWSDSKVALYWIRGKEKNWKPWVENRAVKIRRIVDREKWFHVAGCLNPADIPTRKCDEYMSAWLNGPDFLKERVIEMKGFGVKEEDLDEANKEQRTEASGVNVLVCAADGIKSTFSEVFFVGKYGSLKRLIAVVGFVYRFIANLKVGAIERQLQSVLTSEEYGRALDSLLKEEQFYMAKKENFPKLMSSLKLFCDSSGLFRLKGRFANSDLIYEQQHPIILRSDSHFTKLVIRDAHERVFHQGVESTLSKVREDYWIPKGRKTVKTVLRMCYLCLRYQGKPIYPPETPDLPDFRVSHRMHAFQATGFDCAGPLYVKDGQGSTYRTSKVYILLLTCATSRAVHLELIPDLDSNATIRGLKRFFARRGIPDLVVHDNFKTFRGACVKEFLLRVGVKQRPILAKAPWWGGFYERLVRTVKLSLVKVLRKAKLTFEELMTVLCEVEAVVNGRPLVYASEDDLGEPLSPNHLIHGRNVNRPAGVLTDVEVVSVLDMSKRLKHLRGVVDQFWNKFSNLYLNELRQKHIYSAGNERSSSVAVSVGDVVVIKEEPPVPRSRWRVGVVLELVVGDDGCCRGAKVRVLSKSGKPSVCSRPLQKLVLLELHDTTGSVKSDDSSTAQVNTRYTQRKAAILGQYERRLRENFTA